MEIDLSTKEQLADLLAKPAMVTQAHAGMLTTLVKKYPYYQPLHLLLAKANALEANHSNSLATAALYNGGSLVHRVIYQPETLATVFSSSFNADEIDNEQIEPAEDIELIEPTPIEDNLTDDQETFDEIAEIQTIPTTESKTDEQEVFDEIVEVDSSEFVAQATAKESENEEPLAEAVPDELAIESIVATDFFAFEKSFSTEQAVENLKTEPVNVAMPEEYNQEAEAQTVSKYDDDKLPYTFLWWLAKTRKEHDQIFQPYVTPKKNDNPAPAAPGELQQQYVEHIFHIQTPFNVADEANKGPQNRQVAAKGLEIIDSFIKNEPQIRAPKPEQINNENKAKKSAEDNYDLVSETLAAIYIEQMLYHKAIDTYEKLSLKFPEKSRYFADLIQSLEKKI
ncbi:hypothetical protein [Pedobacter boryungensis]|uniref:Uncharacterized protein n=1 Tax=Pedobacter boryungensis TaxID=869962 RepID=A0ABX2DCV0_9SPHI|nr:hypothetical protein [Pedobacter boryungensis]NQX31895.1 hypothetical protein [Pedobacter boryungensis]